MWTGQTPHPGGYPFRVSLVLVTAPLPSRCSETTSRLCPIEEYAPPVPPPDLSGPECTGTPLVAVHNQKWEYLEHIWRTFTKGCDD